jgi:hypothetical protein
MPTKRRMLPRYEKPRIDDEAVRLFMRVLEIRSDPDWEDDPVLYRECCDTSVALNFRLQCWPHMFGPLDATADGVMPSSLRDTWESWHRAVDLRRELEAAARERQS